MLPMVSVVLNHESIAAFILKLRAYVTVWRIHFSVVVWNNCLFFGFFFVLLVLGCIFVFICHRRLRVWAAIQLTWACGTTACALRATSEQSFTDLGRMDIWVGCWLVLGSSSSGIRALARRPETLRLNHSVTLPSQASIIGHTNFKVPPTLLPSYPPQSPYSLQI